jgi:hypothetical protein
VVNELAEPVTLRIDHAATAVQGTALGWVLDGRDLNGKQVRWNGVPGNEGGGGPFPIDAIAPYSAHFDARSPVELSIPPHSAAGIVLY